MGQSMGRATRTVSHPNGSGARVINEVEAAQIVKQYDSLSTVEQNALFDRMRLPREAFIGPMDTLFKHYYPIEAYDRMIEEMEEKYDINDLPEKIKDVPRIPDKPPSPPDKPPSPPEDPPEDPPDDEPKDEPKDEDDDDDDEPDRDKKQKRKTPKTDDPEEKDDPKKPKKPSDETKDDETKDDETKELDPSDPVEDETKEPDTQKNYTDVELPPHDSYLPTIKPPNTDDINEANDDVTQKDQEAIINHEFTMANVREYQQRADHMYLIQQSQEQEVVDSMKTSYLHSTTYELNDTVDAPKEQYNRSNPLFKVNHSLRMPFEGAPGYSHSNFSKIGQSITDDHLKNRANEAENLLIGINTINSDDQKAYIDDFNRTTFNRDVGNGLVRKIFNSGIESTSFQIDNKKSNYKLNNVYNSNLSQLREPEYRRKHKLY